MKRFIYDYSKPLDKSDVNVYMLNIGKTRPDSDYILNGIEKASIRYNYNFHLINKSEFENNKFSQSNSKVRLLIVLSTVGFDRELVEKSLKKIHAREFTCVSFAFTFKSTKEMFGCINDIEEFKGLSDDRINFLRPNIFKEDSIYVSKEKIIDNSICDSVRIKYIPKIVDQNELHLNIDTLNFFKEASNRYRDDVLYHRSPSDGYFAIRSETNPESFYITATKTYKDHLDSKRISEVLKYDELSNELYYRGNYLPSSDSVEAAMVFKLLPKIKTIVHTHASIQFTRNQNFKHKVTVPIAPYGEYKTGLLLVNALKKEDDGFIIMEDHGEVFVSYDNNLSPTLVEHLEIIKQKVKNEFA